MNVALRRAAVINAQGLAIINGPERRSWQQTLRRIRQRAANLQTAGLEPGTHVALLALNSPAYFECLLAVWWAGGVLVPINTRLAYEEIRFITGHSESRIFIADASFGEVAARLAQDVEGLSQVMALTDDPPGSLTADSVDAPSDSLAGIFYTGGTTGLPKGVELTHANFLFSAMSMQREMVHDMQTVYQHASPLFHLADFTIGLGVLLGAGGHSFMSRFTAEGFYRQLREDGVTHLQLVPTMLAQVLDSPHRDDTLLAGIRSVSYGAAPVSEALLKRLIEAAPHARIQQFYGMTECCGASVTLQSDRNVLAGPRAGKLRSAGQAMAGFEVRIVDSSSSSSSSTFTLTPCPEGQTGEVLARGPGVMRGYWKDADRTSETLVDGWLRSGDVGFMDDDGFVYIVDRLKDMIISGGENIYCAEVENALATFPGVVSCAVFGVADEVWGERVHAVIVVSAAPDASAGSGADKDGARPAVSAAALDQHCRSRIAGFKVPRSYDIRIQPLPLSAVGKVQKTRLRDEWMQSMARHQEAPGKP